MSSDPSSLLVYVKNDIGIAMPVFVRKEDRVDAIWDEVATSRKLNQGVIKGKALVHNGKRLFVTDVIGETGIQPYDYIFLRTMPAIDLHQLSVPFEHNSQQQPLHRSPSGFNECP